MINIYISIFLVLFNMIACKQIVKTVYSHPVKVILIYRPRFMIYSLKVTMQFSHRPHPAYDEQLYTESYHKCVVIEWATGGLCYSLKLFSLWRLFLVTSFVSFVICTLISRITPSYWMTNILFTGYSFRIYFVPVWGWQYTHRRILVYADLLLL